MTLEVVIDTNILFSALIKSGKIRRLILTRGILKLHIPEELAQELHNHTEKLKKYLDLETTEIHKLIDEFIREVATTHRKEEYKHTLQRARKLVERSDPTDAPFVALAIHLGIPLWTGDHRLIELSVKQNFKDYIALDTKALEMLIEGVEWKRIEEYLKERYGQDINTKGQEY